MILLLFKSLCFLKSNISVFCSMHKRVPLYSFLNPFVNMKSLYSVIVLLFLSVQIQATTFIVSNLNDAGPGSLRQAINNANADLTASSASPHIIDVNQAGTIFLNSVLPDILNHVIINGNAALTTVRRGTINNHRIFTVKAPYTVEMNGIRCENGDPGGSNQGGGIFNDGATLVLNDCVIADNFSGAAAGGHGGGLAQSSGTLTINNSTIKNNDSGNNGQGGGIYIADGTVSLFNCTVQNNSTGGNNAGAIMVDGSSILNLTNCTVIQNYSANNTGFSSGGVFYGFNAILNMRNTILANNNSVGVPNGDLNSFAASYVGINDQNIVMECAGAFCPGFASTTDPLLSGVSL